MSETYLFIGGPMDGQRKHIAENHDYIIAPAYNQLAYADDKPETVRYHRSRFVGSTKEYTVLVAEGLTGDDALQKLIDNYR